MQADTTAVESTANAVPRSFYIIAVLFLIWNAIGVSQYLLQAFSTPAELGQTPEQVAYLAQMPAWVVSAFAVAVFAGLAGSLVLLVRHHQAIPLFTVSLLAALVQNAYGFMNDAFGIFGTGALVVSGLVIVIGIVQIGYARTAYQRGWLR